MATQPASPRQASGVAVESVGAGFAAATAIADHVLDRQAAANVVVIIMTILESLSTMHLAYATQGARRIAVLRDVASHTTSSTVTVLWIFFHINLAIIAAIAIAVPRLTSIAEDAARTVFAYPLAVRTTGALRTTAAAVVRI